MGRGCWLFLLIFVLLAISQEIKIVEDPLTYKIKYELAAAQRDYLAAQQQLNLAIAKVKEKYDIAEKVCSPKVFDVSQFSCVERKDEHSNK